MKRHAITILCAISLLASIAALVLSVVGGSAPIASLNWPAWCDIYLNGRMLCFQFEKFDHKLTGQGLVSMIFYQWQWHWNHLGFEFGRGDNFDYTSRTCFKVKLVGIPLWFVALACAAAPLWRGRQLYRHLTLQRRAARGLCRSCGCDLRATTERCPECGTETNTPAGVE